MSKKPIYHVEHKGHSGGPTFTSLWDAVRFIAHCMKNGNDQMTIWVEK